MADEDSAHAEPPVPLVPSARTKWRNRMPLIAVIVITLLGISTVFIDVFSPTTEEPLDAHSHAVVQQACDTAYRTLKALPPLTHRTTRAQQRARIVEENAVFDAMIAKFAPLRPLNHDGRIALSAWTADWKSVLARRADYANELAATTGHVNLVIPIDSQGAPVTDRMNQYSRTHDLDQCLTENLQLETLGAIREYPATDTQSDE